MGFLAVYLKITKAYSLKLLILISSKGLEIWALYGSLANRQKINLALVVHKLFLYLSCAQNREGCPIKLILVNESSTGSLVFLRPLIKTF